MQNQVTFKQNFWSQEYTQAIQPLGRAVLLYVHAALMADMKLSIDAGIKFTGINSSTVGEWLAQFIDDGVIDETDLASYWQ